MPIVLWFRTYRPTVQATNRKGRARSHEALGLAQSVAAWKLWERYSNERTFSIKIDSGSHYRQDCIVMRKCRGFAPRSRHFAGETCGNPEPGTALALCVWRGAQWNRCRSHDVFSFGGRNPLRAGTLYPELISPPNQANRLFEHAMLGCSYSSGGRDGTRR